MSLICSADTAPWIQACVVRTTKAEAQQSMWLYQCLAWPPLLFVGVSKEMADTHKPDWVDDKTHVISLGVTLTLLNAEACMNHGSWQNIIDNQPGICRVAHFKPKPNRRLSVADFGIW